MYGRLLFLFLLSIYYSVNKGCGTTVNGMVRPLISFTCVYIILLCTRWPYIRVAFPKLVDTDLPIPHSSTPSCTLPHPGTLSFSISFIHSFSEFCLSLVLLSVNRSLFCLPSLLSFWKRSLWEIKEKDNWLRILRRKWRRWWFKEAGHGGW